MKVCGFTFIRNAIKYDFPILEAVHSILPICDHFIIAVGNSDDDTLNHIKNIHSSKVEIIHTIWDESKMKAGAVLADETNKAFQAISHEYEWAFYIQGDEVVHENDLPVIQNAMKKYLNDPKIDGLLFHYRHFYGSYDFIGNSSQWYKKEVRVIKNIKSISSYKDAQGFRKNKNEKIKSALINANINHYGWVKEPSVMQQKKVSFGSIFHGEKTTETQEIEFNYAKHINSLSKFSQSHPKVMQTRIEQKNWKFEYDISFNKVSLKDKFKNWALHKLGWTIGFKNYKIITIDNAMK